MRLRGEHLEWEPEDKEQRKTQDNADEKVEHKN